VRLLSFLFDCVLFVYSSAVTRIMQLKTGRQVGAMMRNSIAAKATRMLALARDYYATLPPVHSQ
jgi:hypothetical protein